MYNGTDVYILIHQATSATNLMKYVGYERKNITKDCSNCA